MEPGSSLLLCPSPSLSWHGLFPVKNVVNRLGFCAVPEEISKELCGQVGETSAGGKHFYSSNKCSGNQVNKFFLTLLLAGILHSKGRAMHLERKYSKC